MGWLAVLLGPPRRHWRSEALHGGEVPQEALFRVVWKKPLLGRWSEAVWFKHMIQEREGDMSKKTFRKRVFFGGILIISSLFVPVILGNLSCIVIPFAWGCPHLLSALTPGRIQRGRTPRVLRSHGDPRLGVSGGLNPPWNLISGWKV